MEYESMTAIEFIEQYTKILEEIDSLVHPDCYPAMRVMYCVDPHDLITPHAYFANGEQAFGFVWKLLAAKVKELKNAN
jgi:hypothetical protein